MKKALKVSDLIQTEESKGSSGHWSKGKGIEFTHELTCDTPQDSRIDRIVYLGYCQKDGDMFAVYSQESYTTIYKGHLNDGTY